MNWLGKQQCRGGKHYKSSRRRNIDQSLSHSHWAEHIQVFLAIEKLLFFFLNFYIGNHRCMYYINLVSLEWSCKGRAGGRGRKKEAASIGLQLSQCLIAGINITRCISKAVESEP